MAVVRGVVFVVVATVALVKIEFWRELLRSVLHSFQFEQVEDTSIIHERAGIRKFWSTDDSSHKIVVVVRCDGEDKHVHPPITFSFIH